MADTTIRLDLPGDAVATPDLRGAPPGAERLALVLADQRSRWLAGEPIETERYLAEIPDLAGDRDSRLALVEGEIRARKAAGAMPTLEEFLDRFPDLRDEITALFGSDAARSGGSGDPTASYAVDGRDVVVAERTVHDFIGRYQILRVIGRGGFGVVYLGRDELLGRLVAIKVPRLDRGEGGEGVDAFLREARILAELDHEHIVPVYDVGRTRDGLCFVVSKWIDGDSLTRQALGDEASPERIARLVAAVAEALAHAHERGLIHRDVKPSNVLIDAARKPYLTDFGLALREEDFARGAAVAGTPAYMSPEQARGEWHRVDARTDIFSLGIVLYELLSGSHPYGTGLPSTIMRRIAVEGPMPPRQVGAALPRELERICLRALAPRASDRYADARELAGELRDFAGESAAGPDEAPVPSASPVVPKGLRSFGPEDAGFFLDLLHGPRDRDGLPGAVRFWKARIEEEASFPVGVIYGPSGCGKSSMVRAGLLPRLAPRVVSIYEGATSDLESRLLARVRRACPRIGPAATLVEALTEIRRGALLRRGSRLLIVLDQFEQWLHARAGGTGDGLVRALRQCDGDRLQALVIVRVDFWMAAGRFMQQLEVPVVEGENASAVDLFPMSHARKVLAAFGAAYGALPAPPAGPDEEQEAFLDRAVAMMAEDGTVSPVRLSLFAEMVKDRPWTAGALGDLGGAVGIGVRFLDETFVAGTAPPEHRLHRDAAGRVLSAMLPGPGADIRGHVRPYRELMAASGYADDPGRFEALMRILDAGTRLITPIAPVDPGSDETWVVGAGGRDATPGPESRPYQLTHDYLVPSIREWLARRQKETRRGRAELALAERAALWGARRERKQLPSPWEWASIRLLTGPGGWTDAQRAMMRAAGRHHLARAGRWALLLIAIGLGAAAARRRVDEDRSRLQAEGLVHRLLDADPRQVPAIVADLGPARRWADPALREALRDPAARPMSRLHARLALLPVDPDQAGPLLDAMLAADPDAFVVVRDALFLHRVDLIPRLRRTADSPASPADAAFRAAVALAAYDPEDTGWPDRAATVARRLLEQPSLRVPAWVDRLRPARDHLLPAMAARLRDRAEDEPLVASILASYADDRPGLVAASVADAGTEEFAVLLASRWREDPRAPAATAGELDRRLRAYRAGPTDADAGRIANLAIARLRLGRGDDLWPLLRSGPDPRIRSYLIDRIGPLRCDPAPLIDRLRRDGDPSIRAALILALGRFGDDPLSGGARAGLIPELIALYEDDPDPGAHAAAGWLLSAWGRSERARAIDAGLATGRVEGGRRWYVTTQGQTMVRLDGRQEFAMGSPKDEPWRRSSEDRRLVRVRPFDIAATEVTIGQFGAFVEDWSLDHSEYRDPAGTDPRLPRTLVNWYDAAAYCNWLSEREGLPPDQWCYEPNDRGKYEAGMTIVADFHRRTGYRLPLESEWEYACRAGTVTPRSFGESDALLDRYACYAANSSGRALPVGSLLPNGHGLFDMHGNVNEWCQDAEGDAHRGGGGDVLTDSNNRRVRGGGFVSSTRRLRSAMRYMDRPVLRNEAGGFRVVRSRPAIDR